MKLSDGKIINLCKEAEREPLHRIWEVRAEHPIVARVAETAFVASLKCDFLKSALKKQASDGKNFPGYKLVNGGFEQAVYRNGQNILKILFNTHRFPDSTADEIANRLQTESDRCAQDLGDAWTSTEFDVAELKNRDAPVVISHQPYVNATKQFAAVSVLVADQTVPSEVKRDFGHKLQQMRANTGLDADLIGENNIVLTEDRLQIVDTVPMDSEWRKVMCGNGPTFGELLDLHVNSLVSVQ